MSKVYVIQDQLRKDKTSGKLVSKFDLKDAERYGTIEFLLGPGARPFSPEHVIAQLERKLKSYTPEDWLLLIGNPCLIGFAVAVASVVARGRVRLLQWDGMAGEYRPIHAKLPTELSDEDLEILAAGR